MVGFRRSRADWTGASGAEVAPQPAIDQRVAGRPGMVPEAPAPLFAAARSAAGCDGPGAGPRSGASRAGRPAGSCRCPAVPDRFHELAGYRGRRGGALRWRRRPGLDAHPAGPDGRFEAPPSRPAGGIHAVRRLLSGGTGQTRGSAEASGGQSRVRRLSSNRRRSCWPARGFHPSLRPAHPTDRKPRPRDRRVPSPRRRLAPT